MSFSVAPHREDMYSQDSIDLLQNSGLQFKKHEEEGIDTLYFAELLMTSGLVLCENVKWLSFHRSVVCSDLSFCILVPVQRTVNPAVTLTMTSTLSHVDCLLVLTQ